MSWNLMSKHVIWDEELVLHDGAAAVTADGAGQVDGSAKIIDISAVNISSAAVQPASAPDTWGLVMIDVSAFDSTTGDELVWIYLQASDSSSFASDIINFFAYPLGNVTLGGADVDTGVDQFVFPFLTWVRTSEDQNRRYVRAYLDVAGTTPSITCVIRLGMM